MLSNIVVDCSPLTNTLRIGRLDRRNNHLTEWEAREDEILNAVRDFLVAHAEKEGWSQFGYEWPRKDGKIVTLRVDIRDQNKEAT